jgi:predicted enzyme related to lactoylglutathione lyase
VEAAEFILYVADQARATAFYRHVLAAEPVLEVPGMTEFGLDGAALGLMPVADMEDLLAGRIRGGSGQRCELYLRRADAPAVLARAVASGGELLDGLRDRSWGERVGYALDPDGHVLAIAMAPGPDARPADTGRQLPPSAIDGLLCAGWIAGRCCLQSAQISGPGTKMRGPPVAAFGIGVAVSHAVEVEGAWALRQRRLARHAAA